MFLLLLCLVIFFCCPEHYFVAKLLSPSCLHLKPYSKTLMLIINRKQSYMKRGTWLSREIITFQMGQMIRRRAVFHSQENKGLGRMPNGIKCLAGVFDDHLSIPKQLQTLTSTKKANKKNLSCVSPKCLTLLQLVS